MPADPQDKRLNSPQLFRKKNPDEPTPLEKVYVHLLRKIYDTKKCKWIQKYVRRPLGIKRARYIRENTGKISAEDIASKLKMSLHEVRYVQCLMDDDQVRNLPGRPKTVFEQYQDDVNSSYEDVPLGANGPIHTEQYYFPSTINSRMSEVGTRTIKY